jgi:hypothetical protein
MFSCRPHLPSRLVTHHVGAQQTDEQTHLQALGVKFVWPDEGCKDADFCLWAGRIADDSHLRENLASSSFNFNILVHSDAKALNAVFLESCATVHVHSRTSPRALLEFLLSNSAALAQKSCTQRLEHSEVEDALLDGVRRALGARHVVRICARDRRDVVEAALRRLIDGAPAIRDKIDLQGVCLAIDDNYHLWDSGYVSIPFDFDLDTMTSEVTKLLAPTTDVGEAAVSAADGNVGSDRVTTSAALGSFDDGVRMVGANPVDVEALSAPMLQWLEGHVVQPSTGASPAPAPAPTTAPIRLHQKPKPAPWLPQPLPPLAPFDRPAGMPYFSVRTIQELAAASGGCSSTHDAADERESHQFQKEVASLASAVALAKRSDSLRNADGTDGTGGGVPTAVARTALLPAAELVDTLRTPSPRRGLEREHVRAHTRRGGGAPAHQAVSRVAALGRLAAGRLPRGCAMLW